MHEHKWELISKDIIESDVSKLAKLAIEGKREFNYQGLIEGPKIMYVFQCSICSKIRIEER